MTPRLPRSPEELQDVAHHLDYELDSHARMARRLPRETDVLLSNALLEATLLHARALIEFLVGRSSRRATDTQPDDFALGWTSPNSDAADRLRSSLAPLDRYLSHLSWSRGQETRRAGRPPRWWGKSWR